MTRMERSEICKECRVWFLRLKVERMHSPYPPNSIVVKLDLLCIGFCPGTEHQKIETHGPPQTLCCPLCAEITTRDTLSEDFQAEIDGLESQKNE